MSTEFQPWLTWPSILQTESVLLQLSIQITLCPTSRPEGETPCILYTIICIWNVPKVSCVAALTSSLALSAAEQAVRDRATSSVSGSWEHSHESCSWPKLFLFLFLFLYLLHHAHSPWHASIAPNQDDQSARDDFPETMGQVNIFLYQFS